MSCSKCMTTKDKDGKPVSYCTGMCNVIVLALNKVAKQMLITAGITLSVLLPIIGSAQNTYRTNLSDCTMGYPVYAAGKTQSHVIRPMSHITSHVDFYHFNYYKTASERSSCNVDVTFDDKRLTITVDDVPVHYDVIYIERSPGRDKIVKIITYAEPVKGEKVRPRYRWYYVPDKDKFVCSDTGISFSN